MKKSMTLNRMVCGWLLLLTRCGIGSCSTVTGLTVANRGLRSKPRRERYRDICAPG
jgi:hypothetical protein